jgi:hypothetical protein
MSKIALSGNASGTGTFTLASPNSNSDRTLNLPDNSGTLLSNASTAGFPAGSVLQVVNAVYTDETSSSSTTFADTGLTATITPSSATSKILVLVNHAGCGKNTGETQLQIRLMRNGSQILYMEDIAAATASSATNFVGAASSAYLDSPSTTSAVVYKTQLASRANVAFVFIGGYGSVKCSSTITLMEIAG